RVRPLGTMRNLSGRFSFVRWLAVAATTAAILGIFTLPPAHAAEARTRSKSARPLVAATVASSIAAPRTSVAAIALPAPTPAPPPTPETNLFAPVRQAVTDTFDALGAVANRLEGSLWG